MFEETNSILNSIIVGGTGGALAGLTVIFVQYVHGKCLERRDKKRIFDWMHIKISSDQKGIKYLSTRTVASYTNLTEDRVRYICSVHECIYLSTGEHEDMWGIKELSGRR
jgi:hypothetical protein